MPISLGEDGGGEELGWLPGGLGGSKGGTPTSTRDLPRVRGGRRSPPQTPPRPQERSKGVNRKLGMALPGGCGSERRARSPPRPGGPRAALPEPGGVPRCPPHPRWQARS